MCSLILGNKFLRFVGEIKGSERVHHCSGCSEGRKGHKDIYEGGVDLQLVIGGVGFQKKCTSPILSIE